MDERRPWIPPQGMPAPAVFHHQQLPQQPGFPYSQPPQMQPAQSPAFFPPPQVPQQSPMHSSPGRFKILQDSIISLDTHYVLFIISRPKKTSLYISHTQSNAVLGTIKIHSFLSSDVDLTINGRPTTIEKASLQSLWSFTSPMANGGTFWWLPKGKKDDDDAAKSVLTDEVGDLADNDDDDDGLRDLLEADDSGELKGALVLKDAKKHGQTIARMSGNVLEMKVAAANQALIEEVIVSAVAMTEVVKKKKKEEKQALKLILHATGAS